METIVACTLRGMLLQACTAIEENETRLCELDSFVGDGDHGVTVARGFRAVRKNLEQSDEKSISALLLMTGETLTEAMGGAIGPIFGSIFTAAAEDAEGKEALTLKDFASLWDAGLENVMLIGGAKRGERTLVDSLAPAVEQLSSDAQENIEIKAALQNAVAAAARGVESTKDMVAKKGRAKFLGEKSRGFQDAGATSLYLVLEAMAKYLNEEASRG